LQKKFDHLECPGVDGVIASCSLAIDCCRSSWCNINDDILDCPGDMPAGDGYLVVWVREEIVEGVKHDDRAV
jgi:hypothetical protein